MSRQPGTSVAIINRDDIIEQVRQGVRLIDIAKSYGLKSHAAITNQLANDPEYQAAREDGLAARMDIREEQLESSQDNVSVARARELLSHARWRAERECPKRWGQQQSHASHAPVAVQINIGAVSPHSGSEHSLGGGGTVVDGESNS